jgi:Uma2 family endonuclease
MVAPSHKLTSSEFLSWERAQTTKHEFFHGDVFAMAGGSPRHNRLCSRITRLLDVALSERGCHVLSSDQRVGLDRGERYVYPDVTVVCGPLSVVHDDVLTNPTIVVEVLSLSTEQNDRGSKWQSYQQLASLTDYVLVPQWTSRLEHFQRDPRGGWTYRSVGAGEQLVLSDGSRLAVDEVFVNVMELPGDLPPPVAT